MQNTSDFMFEGFSYNLVFEVLRLNWQWLEYDINGFAKEATIYSLWSFHDRTQKYNLCFLYNISPALKAPTLYLCVYSTRVTVFESIFINEC